MNPLSSSALFLSAALLFGTAFAVLIPPFQSPDEPNHFLRAYQVSEGVFFPEEHDRRLGGVLPVSLAQVCDSFSYMKMNYEARLNKGLIFRCLNIPLNPEQRAFTDFPNTAIYAPTAYLPQAVTIALLRPAGATPLQMLYACRLANLLIWAIFVRLAIGLIPFLPNTLAALGLLPASLVIAASANADVVTNGLCWWLVAGFCAGKLPGFKYLAATAIVCANKLIALPLVLLSWLRFHRSPSGRGDAIRLSTTSRPPFPVQAMRKRFILLLTVAFTAALTWGYLAQKWFIPYDCYNPDYRNAQTLNEGVDPARQQAFILDNPLSFTKIAITSAIRALPSAGAHFVGKFGWETNYLPRIWLAALWLVLAAMTASMASPFSGRQRLLAAITVLFYVAMFIVTMYSLWCPVGANEVTNFQGRYFVPVAPVAVLVFAGGWLKKWEKPIWQGTIAILIMGNLTMAHCILMRYYAADGYHL